MKLFKKQRVLSSFFVVREDEVTERMERLTDAVNST